MKKGESMNCSLESKPKKKIEGSLSRIQCKTVYFFSIPMFLSGAARCIDRPQRTRRLWGVGDRRSSLQLASSTPFITSFYIRTKNYSSFVCLSVRLSVCLNVSWKMLYYFYYIYYY